MQKILSIETLLQTPVCMMTGEQLAFLVTNLPLLNKQGNKASSEEEAAKPRRLVVYVKGAPDILLDMCQIGFWHHIHW